jgi:hypothetical protein
MPFAKVAFGYFFWKYSLAMAGYLPKALAVRSIFFAADYNGEAWRRISPDLEIVKLPGGHYGVPTNPAILAEHLRARYQEKITPLEHSFAGSGK